MQDAQSPTPSGSISHPLRTCPDCGGILEPSRPQWTTMVNMVAGRPDRTGDAARWQCLICGYKG